MSVMPSDSKKTEKKVDLRSLRFLNPRQVLMIDEALSKVGEFGEVRLIIEKGRVRFLITQNSYDVLKWRPENLTNLDR